MGLSNTPTSALHAHESALHQVDAPDAVLASHLVQLGEQGGGGHLDAVDGDGVPLLELDLHEGGHVGGLQREGAIRNRHIKNENKLSDEEQTESVREEMCI